MPHLPNGPWFEDWRVGRVIAPLLMACLGGKRGPSIDRQRRPKDLIVDELIGKLGPIISVYNAEGTNRIAGEWE